MRIGKKGEPPLHDPEASLGIGKAQMLRDGRDLLVVGVGPILGEAIKASEALISKGLSVAVASLGGVKPLEDAFLQEMAKRFPRWLSLEEHGITGGLGSALLEWLADNQVTNVRLRRLAVPDTYLHELGNQAYTRSRLGLDAESLFRSFQAELVLIT
jgi:transketolase